MRLCYVDESGDIQLTSLDKSLDGLANQIGVLALSASLESDLEQEAGPKHAHHDGRSDRRHG